MDLFVCNMTNIYKDNIPSYLKAYSTRTSFRGTFMNEQNLKLFYCNNHFIFEWQNVITKLYLLIGPP